MNACFYKYILLYIVYIKALLWLTVSKTNYCKRKGTPVSKWFISFLSCSPGLPLRLTMQFRTPTHAKLRKRLTRSMLQLNANNHSLTCTSEYKMHLVCIHTHFCPYLSLSDTDLWAASTSTWTVSLWLGKELFYILTSH